MPARRPRRRAAASPRTRPASCCAGSPSPATTSRSCRPRPRCEFVGAADLGGAVRASRSPPTSGTDVHEVPHVRIGQTADLVVVAPATADLLARAAHGLADDLLTNTLLTARCPVVFAPAMHTEMWEHPATQANVATLRRRGRAGPRARRGPADRRRHRQGPAARARRDLRARRARCWRAPGAADPLDLAGRHVVVTRRRHPRAPRPGPLPGQPLLRPAGLRARPGRRRPRRRGHPGRRQRRAARPGRRQGRAGRDHRRAARRRARRAPRPPTPS